ncbi:hypothetical protein ACF0H5_020279 [Mactra antiquata]
MNSNMDLNRQFLEISDTRDIVSLEVIQRQKVQLEFLPSNSGETITAELVSKDCSSSSPCFKLHHSTLQTDLQSYLTIFVQAEDEKSSFFNATCMVFGVLSILLLFLCVRQWLKKTCSNNSPVLA